MREHPLLKVLFDALDTTVEVYLANIIKPFLQLHEKFYHRLNVFLRETLDKSKVPNWFTANFVTYLRTTLTIPCLQLLSWGYVVLPCIIVLSVDFGDFLDGVVARYWVDIKKEREEAHKKSLKNSDAKAIAAATSSDTDGFEVFKTGSPQCVSSWLTNQRNRTYGGFIDAVCDKAFVVPCWIFLLSRVASKRFQPVQYLTLWCLSLAEIASASIRFKAYYTSGGVPAPGVVGLDFSHSAVKADHIGKAKQTFEMVGTALYMLPYLPGYIGLLLLMLAVPLAYESVRRKVLKRTMYVDGTVSKFDHRTLKFWTQVKGMGSKLVVGVSGQSTDMVLNACSSVNVDEVIAEAPTKVDLHFLNEHGIDFVVCAAGKPGLVPEEDVLAASRCLSIGDDGNARPMAAKGKRKD